MILFVSGRTDVVAFYSDWFMKRYQEGFVDVRNPFNAHFISRIYFNDVDALFFCTKNPLPILDKIKEIKLPILFHVTLTPYKKEIEPNVPNKRKVIEAIKELSEILGKNRVVVRYDPIFLSDTYPLEYHLKAFDRMCSLLDGYVEQIIVSFLDDYKNVRRNWNILNPREFTKNDYKVIGESFSKSARAHGMTVQTCFEEETLVEYGFTKNDCLSSEIAFQLTGKNYPKWKARKEGKCNCVSMVDIGDYNSCKHLCKYCYANYDEGRVEKNRLLHDPNSSLLLGHLTKEDNIKVRKK